MSGGGNKKKKSTNSSGNTGKNANSKQKQKSNILKNTNESILSDDEQEIVKTVAVDINEAVEEESTASSIDVLDRLAPPVLFFPPNVAEEYIQRFCPVTPILKGSSKKNLLAEEGFPEREVPVMRRLLAMMAGIMSKASAAAARAYYSRVAGTEGRRNGYFQQNLNTSVFNLFSTLSAGNNPNGVNRNNSNINPTTASTKKNMPNSDTLHLTPPAAFTAKDGEPLRGYPTRLMKFWRQLSLAEQVRLVREEHAALTNEWIESRKSWCLCAHCKHRRMTINDLTDCVYQTYCEELEAFISSNGNGSTLYSPSLNSSLEPSAKARRFLFRSLSVVGEQALLPRYNQFILRLEAFSSMAFSMKAGNGPPQKHPLHAGNQSHATTAHVHTTKIKTPLKNITKDGIRSAALQASKEFLQRAHPGKHLHETDEIEELFFDSEYLKQLSRSIDGFDEDDVDCGGDEYSEKTPHQDKANQGGIQSEDDDDIIDEETDLPIDESELMLPGGSSFPLLPVGEGPVQWSEASRIECGRTVFLMFASEMFQYRLAGAYLDKVTRERQLQLLAEVEEEERLEKIKKQKELQKAKEKAEMEKKKKQMKKEKAAANNSDKRAALAASKKKPNSSTIINNNNYIPSKTSSSCNEIVSSSSVIDVEDGANDEEEVEEEEEEENVEVKVVENEETHEVCVNDADKVLVTDHPVVVVKEDSVLRQESTDEVVKSASTEVDSRPILAHIPLKIEKAQVQVQIPTVLETSVTSSAHFSDDDFDPTQLIEQLSKEMNSFELNSLPPGFDTSTELGPPGFVVTAPKHLDIDENEFVRGMSSSKPVASHNEGINTLNVSHLNSNNNFSNPPFSLFNQMEFYQPNQPQNVPQQHQPHFQYPAHHYQQQQRQAYSTDYFSQYPQNQVYPPHLQTSYSHQYNPQIPTSHQAQPNGYGFQPQYVPMMNNGGTSHSHSQYQNLTRNQVSEFNGYQNDFIPPNYHVNYQNASSITTGTGTGNSTMRLNRSSVDINANDTITSVNINNNSSKTSPVVNTNSTSEADSITGTGTSRFQSFFSNSIFGPSSFFSS